MLGQIVLRSLISVPVPVNSSAAQIESKCS